VNGSLDSMPPAPGDTLPRGDVDFFRFTGTPGAVVTIDLEGQSTGKGTLYDPFLGAFERSCGLIAATDTGGVGLNARLTLTIPADSVIILAVTACCDFGFTQGGFGSYQLTIQGTQGPANDAFANATVVPALPSRDTVDITNATMEPNERTPSCSYAPSGRTVWYAFTPTQTRAVSGSVNTWFPTAVAAYSGGSLANLTEVGCRNFGQTLSFQAHAGTTYFFQVDGMFGYAGALEFSLDVAPPPVANFGFYPADASVFDVVQFYDQSYDPAGLGFAPQEWAFGDGTTGTGTNPVHRYAADGDYGVQLAVTTVDGRTATTSQTLHVQTHDVAITKFSVPQTARSGQTRHLVVSINSRRYPETVTVQLFKSVPGGLQQFGSLTQSVPMNPKNGTTNFDFSYTFTADDAQIGKVTFKAVALIVGWRDPLPADNEAVAPATRVSR
jgi:PKD repeat protein